MTRYEHYNFSKKTKLIVLIYIFLVVPDRLHQPHRVILVALNHDERNEDVARARGDRVAAVPHTTRVAAHVALLDGKKKKRQHERLL